MKKCPTCGKEFEDSLKFCQIDGAELVGAEPAFDPYATVVGHKIDLTPAVPEEKVVEEVPSEVAAVEVSAIEPVEEAQIHETTGSIPIAPPDEVLELPGLDPLKTMYVSESELKEALGDIQSPPADEPPFEVNAEHTPPPSPFGAPDSPVMPVAEPIGEMETVLADQSASPFQNQEPAPVAEWTPPPAPDSAWLNQEIGSNTPFQPPPPGAGAPNSTLAIISLVCGILSCSLLCCLGIFLGPISIVLGFMAKKKADENPAEFGGRGLALGGMITGGVGTLFGIGFIIYEVVMGGLALLLSGAR